MKKFGPFLDLGLAATTPYPLDIKIESADGVWLKRLGGEKLFDAISGIGVSNFGHGNKDILKALHAQIDLNLHTMVYGEFSHDSTLMAGELLHLFSLKISTLFTLSTRGQKLSKERSSSQNELLADQG